MMQAQRQMSDSLRLGMLLAAAGGFLDAYSYCIRGGVFATAQTGNIVLLALNAAQLSWRGMFSYLIPIVSFSAGIVMVELVRRRYGNMQWLHWRQLCLFIEIATLIAVGLLPQGECTNALANLLISLVSALQAQSFRAINGNACVTTMCTGNLRSGVELICRGIADRQRETTWRGVQYFLLILFFMFGAATGMLVSRLFYEQAVWACCGVLAIGLIVMHARPAQR